MPHLVRSKLNPEDVEKVDGDDPYDGFRYGMTKIQAAATVVRQAERVRLPQANVHPLTLIADL